MFLLPWGIFALLNCSHFLKIFLQARQAERTEVKEEQKYKVCSFWIFVVFEKRNCVKLFRQERLEENEEAAEERTRKRRCFFCY